MVNIKNRPKSEQEDIDKLTELYLKLERLQGYVRRIEGRMKKYNMDLQMARKAREKKEEEVVQGLRPERSNVSDEMI